MASFWPCFIIGSPFFGLFDDDIAGLYPADGSCYGYLTAPYAYIYYLDFFAKVPGV